MNLQIELQQYIKIQRYRIIEMKCVVMKEVFGVQVFSKKILN